MFRYVMAYENFQIYNPFVSVKLIVWAIFAGIVAASLMAIYNKRVIGGFVKTLLSGGCISPENAKTIVDLGYGTDWAIKNALRTDNVLRRFVVRIDDAGDNTEVNDDNPEAAPADKQRGKKRAHETIDFLTAKFYIPEELKYKAEVRYAGRGTDLYTLGICIVICAAAALLAIYAIPEIIQLIDNFVGTLK